MTLIYSSFNDRNAGIAAAYQTNDYTMKAIADEFGLHYATDTRIVKKSWDMMLRIQACRSALRYVQG